MISLIEFELKFDFFFILYKKTKNIPDCGERLWVCLREIRTAYCSSNIGPIASRGGAEAVERLCPEGGGHSPICQSSGSVWALLSHTGFGFPWSCVEMGFFLLLDLTGVSDWSRPGTGASRGLCSGSLQRRWPVSLLTQPQVRLFPPIKL